MNADNKIENKSSYICVYLRSSVVNSFCRLVQRRIGILRRAGAAGNPDARGGGDDRVGVIIRGGEAGGLADLDLRDRRLRDRGWGGDLHVDRLGIRPKRCAGI